MSDEFTCARCRGTFKKGQSDEEAMAEAEALFAPEEMSRPLREPRVASIDPDQNADLVVLCDDCYKKFLEWAKTSPMAPQRLRSLLTD